MYLIGFFSTHSVTLCFFINSFSYFKTLKDQKSELPLLTVRFLLSFQSVTLTLLCLFGIPLQRLKVIPEDFMHAHPGPIPLLFPLYSSAGHSRMLLTLYNSRLKVSSRLYI